jgi:hypothetical protein
MEFNMEFCIYVVLTMKPRIDDTNLVKCYQDQMACEALSQEYAEANKIYLGGGEPTYRWVCQGKELAPVPEGIEKT